MMHGSASDRTTQQNRWTHGERQIDAERGRRGVQRRVLCDSMSGGGVKRSDGSKDFAASCRLIAKDK